MSEDNQENIILSVKNMTLSFVLSRDIYCFRYTLYCIVDHLLLCLIAF